MGIDHDRMHFFLKISVMEQFKSKKWSFSKISHSFSIKRFPNLLMIQIHCLKRGAENFHRKSDFWVKFTYATLQNIKSFASCYFIFTQDHNLGKCTRYKVGRSWFWAKNDHLFFKFWSMWRSQYKWAHFVDIGLHTKLGGIVDRVLMI